MTIAEAASRFRNGSLTPPELTEDCLMRIEQGNPDLNAFWEVFEHEARADAARAADELRAGRGRGPLHGVPVAVKDLYDVVGRVTTAGSHSGFHPPPATADCEVVRRLRAAGAVLIGKTATHEWAMGVSTNNSHFGPTRNPHDTDRVPGGSSGGSGAAVAAGMVPGALGSDTGGSIRIPAALCGTYGLKPTFGTVDMSGVWPLARSLDMAGPLASTAEDCFLILEAISDSRRVQAKRPRILVASNYFFEDVDPKIGEMVRDAAAALGTVEEVDVGDAAGAWQATITILLSEAAALHEERLAEHPEWFGDGMGDRLSDARLIRGIDYARARDLQRDWGHELDRLLGDDAVLCVPTTPITAPVIGDREGKELARVMTSLTAPFNPSGVPILSVPVGAANGLPVGMQIVAANRQESTLWAAVSQ